MNLFPKYSVISCIEGLCPTIMIVFMSSLGVSGCSFESFLCRSFKSWSTVNLVIG